MKIIERSRFRDDSGAISLENRIRATLEHGLSWYPEMKAQEIVANRLNRNFPTDHVLVLNHRLPRTNIVAPMILINPQGVRVIVPSPLRGVFRAKSEEWHRFNSRARSFTRARPNLQELAMAPAQALHSYLKDQGFPLPEVETVLIFTNPQTHVDSIRPRVRIVLRDAIDHFAANLLQQKPIMDREDIDAVLKAILEPPRPERKPQPEAEAKPVLAGSAEDLAATDPFQLEERGPGGRQMLLGMTRSQLILIAVLAVFEFAILGTLALLVIRDGVLAP